MRWDIYFCRKRGSGDASSQRAFDAYEKKSFKVTSIVIRKILLKLLFWYQKFFTLLGYGSCRYYPTCSQYAKELVMFDNLFTAVLKIVSRILRCNQLFPGGIEYPQISSIKQPRLLCYKKADFSMIRFLFVPKPEGGFYIVKRFKD